MYQGNHYQLMAEYNHWMNQKLYAVCANIPDAKRKADMGAFFKSIHIPARCGQTTSGTRPTTGSPAA